MKSLRAYLAPAFAIASAGILALSLYGCASGPEGPVPPTVAVKILSIPDASRVTVNGLDVGVTPVTVNIAVSDNDAILYPIAIRLSSSSGGGKSGGKSGGGGGGSSGTFPTGKHLPGTVTITSNGITESRDFAPRNPAGTKPTVEEAM